jgi:hypothetical protein
MVVLGTGELDDGAEQSILEAVRRGEWLRAEDVMGNGWSRDYAPVRNLSDMISDHERAVRKLASDRRAAIRMRRRQDEAAFLKRESERSDYARHRRQEETARMVEQMTWALEQARRNAAQPLRTEELLSRARIILERAK